MGQGHSLRARLRPAPGLILAGALVVSSPGVPRPAEAQSAFREIALGATGRLEQLNQLDQSVAALSDGRFAIVWGIESRDSLDLRMQWLSPSGAPLFAPDGIPVASKRRPHELYEAMIADPLGGAFLAFRSESTAYCQRFDKRGRPMWRGRRGIRLTPSASRESQTEVSLTGDAAGGVYVCMGFLGPSSGVRCQHLDRDGRRLWGRSGRTAGGKAGVRYVPRTLPDGAGGLLVFWGNHRNQRDLPELIMGQRFTPDGSKRWGPEGRVIRQLNTSGSQGHTADTFRAVPDGRGGAVVAFEDWFGSPRRVDILAQRIARNGKLLWDDATEVVSRSRFQLHEATVATLDGGVIVIASEAVGAGRWELRGYRLGANGEHLWDPAGVLLSDPASRHDNYFASASYDDGILRLAWSEEQSDGWLNVKFASFDRRGRRLGPAAGIVVSGVADDQFQHGLAYSPVTGAVLTVWDDKRKGDWADLDVYAGFLPLHE